MWKVSVLMMIIIMFIMACSIYADETSSGNTLISEIKGSIIFSKGRYIYKVVIGKWDPVQLGRGDYARWSPDGKLIAVYDRRNIYVMDADGNNRTLVTEEAWQGGGCPIEFHANGREIIFTRRKEQGLWAVDIYSKEVRKILDIDGYPGEIGISADGTRLVYRLVNNLYAYDFTTNKGFIYLKNAYSAGISPDGNLLMNNTDNGNGSHESMNIRSWDGKDVRILRAGICQPDGEWGHHAWSNHNDYITAQGGLKGESYVINIVKNQGTRITWGGKTVYPDLYVEKVLTDTKTGNIDPGSWLLGFIPSAIPESEPKPAVVNINNNYNRTNSRIMIRRVSIPTRANMDFAIYDSNVMRYNPEKFEHKPLAFQELSNLHFQNTLIPESLADRLSSTPLTTEEIASPMSWIPMTEYLMDWDFEQGYAIAKAGWKINEHSWGDDSITEPYQEISRVYIHTNADGSHSLWVMVEFKPYVKFLKDIDDEDSDGFPEIYGMMDSKLLNETIINYLITEYRGKVMNAEEIADWAFKLANSWYDNYATVALKPEQITEWLNTKAEPEIKEEIDKLDIGQPVVFIYGRPYGEVLLNVLLTR